MLLANLLFHPQFAASRPAKQPTRPCSQLVLLFTVGTRGRSAVRRRFPRRPLSRATPAGRRPRPRALLCAGTAMHAGMPRIKASSGLVPVDDDTDVESKPRPAAVAAPPPTIPSSAASLPQRGDAPLSSPAGTASPSAAGRQLATVGRDNRGRCPPPTEAGSLSTLYSRTRAASCHGTRIRIPRRLLPPLTPLTSSFPLRTCLSACRHHDHGKHVAAADT